MLKTWRICWRLTASMGWTFMVALSSFIVCRDNMSGRHRATWFTRVWCAGLLRIIGVKLAVHGDARDFDGRLIVSNHSSYLDIIVHGALTRLRFAAKKEVRHYPVLGVMLATGRPIWVDRENRADSGRALGEFRQSLEVGVNLIVYPEGTTTDGLGALLPFKSTAFQAVCGTNLSIQPIVTCNHLAVDGFNPAWYGDMTMWPHLVKMLSHRRIYCDIYILPVQCARTGETRKELAVRMHSYIRKAMNVIESGDGEAVAKLLV